MAHGKTTTGLWSLRSPILLVKQISQPREKNRKLKAVSEEEALEVKENKLRLTCRRESSENQLHQV